MFNFASIAALKPAPPNQSVHNSLFTLYLSLFH